MRTKGSVAAWYKRMREIESISKNKDYHKARDKRRRIQHQIDLGLRNQDGTPKARLIKKDRHRATEGGALDSCIARAPVETNGQIRSAGSDEAGRLTPPYPKKEGGL